MPGFLAPFREIIVHYSIRMCEFDGKDFSVEYARIVTSECEVMTVARDTCDALDQAGGESVSKCARFNDAEATGLDGSCAVHSSCADGSTKEAVAKELRRARGRSGGRGELHRKRQRSSGRRCDGEKSSLFNSKAPHSSLTKKACFPSGQCLTTLDE